MKQYGKRYSLMALTLVAFLGAAKAAPQRDDFKLDFELLDAASQGETWKVRDALNKGANISARDGQFGWTPLMWAARRARVGTVRFLLERGAPVNARSVSKSRVPILLIPGTTRVGESVTNEDGTQTATPYMQTGFYTENNGITALMLAAASGSNMTALELVKRGADVNAHTNSGETALMCAAFKGYLPTVKTLLARGAKIDARDAYGGTALVSAALEGHTPVVKALLAKGATPNAKWHGRSLITVARYYGHTDIVGLLKRAGATTTVAKTPNKAPAKDKRPAKEPKYPAAGHGVIILN